MQKFGTCSILYTYMYIPAVTPPIVVPTTMSPMGKIFSNHSTWSIQVNKQVCDICDGYVIGQCSMHEKDLEREGKGRMERVS